MRAGMVGLLAAALPVLAQLNLVGDAHMQGETIRLPEDRRRIDPAARAGIPEADPRAVHGGRGLSGSVRAGAAGASQERAGPS